VEKSLFLDRVGADLDAWGYKLNHGCAMEPVKTFRPFTSETFLSAVTGEFRLLSRFGKSIDGIIDERKHG